MSGASPIRLPTIYIPHGGGPFHLIEWQPRDPWVGLRDYLSSLGTLVQPRPRAILVISAHWEEDVVAVQKHPAPKLLFDYYGFPEHTYQISYPAHGAEWSMTAT